MLRVRALGYRRRGGEWVRPSSHFGQLGAYFKEWINFSKGAQHFGHGKEKENYYLL